MKRRPFIQTSVFTALAASLRAATGTRAPRILLRSSWQTVNIGDIAHTPGLLALLEKHLPEAEVRLWASSMTEPVKAMLTKRFPKLRILLGKIGEDGKASNPDLQESLEWSDFFLHGSGPSLVGDRDLAAFDKHFQKPYGVYGITFSGSTPEILALMSAAEFLYFRETVSLEKAKTLGVTCPVMEFGPDTAFAVDLRDDDSAKAFLEKNGLEKGKFLCCIPRLRFTPYWRVKEDRKIDPEKDARNEEMAEHDHAPLREAILAVLAQTDHKVLVCPEDATQMEVGKRWIIDKLPAEALARVVWRENYWLTDEALSTYTMSAGLFGLEMHSPIMCVGNGVPALVGRFAEQTSKGFMWRDIGLGDWLFDFDNEDSIKKLTPALLSLVTDRPAALEKTEAAHAVVQARQKATLAHLRNTLP